MIIAQGKRSAALGRKPNIITFLSRVLFFPGLKPGKNKTRERKVEDVVASTQGTGPPTLRSGGPCPELKRGGTAAPPQGRWAEGQNCCTLEAWNNDDPWLDRWAAA